MLCDWVPQIAVLSHPATMAFLSHGGSNSAMESLLCGMPMSEFDGAHERMGNDSEGAAVEVLADCYTAYFTALTRLTSDSSVARLLGSARGCQ